jgi:hypothetical protein
MESVHAINCQDEINTNLVSIIKIGLTTKEKYYFDQYGCQLKCLILMLKILTEVNSIRKWNNEC